MSSAPDLPRPHEGRLLVAGAQERPASSAATLTFGDPRRYWDFRSVGRGVIEFEEIIVALNDIGYTGPLSVEWEDSRMDREHGARESCAYLRRMDFAPTWVDFEAVFASEH